MATSSVSCGRWDAPTGIWPGPATTATCIGSSTAAANTAFAGCAVGASYAVLVAEQMFASGCNLLLSMTSSGQITVLRSPPYFVLIEKALRDEGTKPTMTSHHPNTVRRPLGLIELVAAGIWRAS